MASSATTRRIRAPRRSPSSCLDLAPSSSSRRRRRPGRRQRGPTETSRFPGPAAPVSGSGERPAPRRATAESMTIEQRVARLDWGQIHADLDARGFAGTGPLLTTRECASVADLYDDDARFRSRVVMAAHGFGRGEYKYFDHPLPPPVETLRRAVYPGLVPVANAWASRMKIDPFPETVDALHDLCRAHGQTRPTPLLLRYGTGDE